MNWTILLSALVGAMLGAGIVLVFIPRKVTYHGVSLEKHNNLVAYYNELDSDLVELRGHLIELDEKFLNHQHSRSGYQDSHEPINTRREVTGYISAAAAPDYDDEPQTRRTRASRNLSTNRNSDTRIRRGSEGRGGY